MAAFVRIFQLLRPIEMILALDNVLLLLYFTLSNIPPGFTRDYTFCMTCSFFVCLIYHEALLSVYYMPHVIRDKLYIPTFLREWHY